MTSENNWVYLLSYLCTDFISTQTLSPFTKYNVEPKKSWKSCNRLNLDCNFFNIQYRQMKKMNKALPDTFCCFFLKDHTVILPILIFWSTTIHKNLRIDQEEGRRLSNSLYRDRKFPAFPSSIFQNFSTYHKNVEV